MSFKTLKINKIKNKEKKICFFSCGFLFFIYLCVVSNIINTMYNLDSSSVIVRFDDRLISLNTLKKLVSAYWYFKIVDKFIRSTSQSVTVKIYNGATVTLIYR